MEMKKDGARRYRHGGFGPPERLASSRELAYGSPSWGFVDDCVVGAPTVDVDCAH